MNIKKNMLKQENKYSKYALKDKDAIRLVDDTDDFRPHFYRDIDRIIYSLSYTRYIDKTQVFSLNNNDHLTKRIIHVQMVSKIARTIGRALNLNEDLIEASSLGHDLGHVPFGHVGEKILSEISVKNNEGLFKHNIQSVRQVMFIENDGKGSNLCIQTMDAIMCHDGESESNIYRPVKKTKEEFLKEYQDSYTTNNKLQPMTLEGCVVKISDIIAYLGRDIEDAIRLGLIEKKDIPNNIKKVLGSTNSSIINTLINDIISNSYNKPYIMISDKVYNALQELKQFNYKYIYDKANSKKQINQYKIIFNTLFDVYLKQLESKDIKSDIYTIYLKDMSKTYIKNNTNARIVIDYLAGMTDDYIISCYNKYNK